MQQMLDMSKKLLENVRFIDLYSADLLEQTNLAIFWKDSKSQFLGYNKVFANICEISDSESIIGKTDYDCPWTNKQSSKFRKDDNIVLNLSCPKLNIKEELDLYNNKKIIILTNKFPIYSAVTKKQGVLGMFSKIDTTNN